MPNRNSLSQMAALVRARQVSPVELVDAHLKQIEKLNPKLNAFVIVTADQARDEARSAERRTPGTSTGRQAARVAANRRRSLRSAPPGASAATPAGRSAFPRIAAGSRYSSRHRVDVLPRATIPRSVIPADSSAWADRW